jgi:hypothetical protein
MGLTRMGPPHALILALKPHAGWTEFIETGTFHGGTTQWASERFEHVTTIELSEAYHSAAKARFRDCPSVRVLQGSSAVVLSEVVPALAGSAIFWLDAHWSGLDTAGRDSECPLLEELKIINAAVVTHTVMVDDARFFCAPPPLPHNAKQWPSLMETVAALHDGGRRHVVLYEDVLIALPTEIKEPLTVWLQQTTRASRRRGPLARLLERIRQ